MFSFADTNCYANKREQLLRTYGHAVKCFTLDKENFMGKEKGSPPFPVTAKFSTLFSDIQGIAYSKLPKFK